jgi:two-component system chemotaxis response regulator CheY
MKKVLLVEDSECIRAITKKVLNSEFEDFEYTEAPDGKLALKAIEEHLEEGVQFDYIISDINMPWMNGGTFVNTWRKHEGFYPSPVLMLSAETQLTTLYDLFDDHITDILHKPFSHQKLCDLIYRMDNSKKKNLDQVKKMVVISNDMQIQKTLVKTSGFFNTVFESNKKTPNQFLLKYEESDLIVIDTDFFPLEKGFELIKEARVEKNLENLNFVLLSSKKFDASFDHFFEFSTLYFVKKDIPSEELIAKLKFCVNI